MGQSGRLYFEPIILVPLIKLYFHYFGKIYYWYESFLLYLIIKVLIKVRFYFFIAYQLLPNNIMVQKILRYYFA